MADNNELVRLEEIIDNLLSKYNKLEEENRKYLTMIKEKNTEIEDLQGKLAGLENDKEQVQKRISGILKTIEDWQSREEDDKEEEEIFKAGTDLNM
ncbi:MAG: hypothetical protein R6V20_10620 [Desulfobia sp.]